MMTEKSPDSLRFPDCLEKLPKHPPKTATQMARLSEKRLPLFNSIPNAQQKRLETKQPAKFKLSAQID